MPVTLKLNFLLARCNILKLFFFFVLQSSFALPAYGTPGFYMVNGNLK